MESTFKVITKHIFDHPVNTTPFYHFVTKNVFPAEFYTELLGKLPDDTSYDWKNEIGTLEDYRGRFCFSRREIADLDRSRQYFWAEFVQHMLSVNFLCVMMGKFRSELNERFDGKLNTPLRAELKLLRDKDNYALKVHTDTPDRVATILFYLPKDDSATQNGTSLFVPKEEGFTCPGTTRHEYEKFETFTTVPFEPNNGLCFMRSNNSFHGVSPYNMSNPNRNVLVLLVSEVKESKMDLKEKLKSAVKHIVGMTPAKLYFSWHDIYHTKKIT